MHASAVLFNGKCQVFTGDPGSGKSVRVALAILAGGTLVADDYIQIDGDHVSAPATIAGVLALRDYGLIRLPYLSSDAPLSFIDCNALPAVSLSLHQWQALSALGESLPEDWMPQRIALYD